SRGSVGAGRPTTSGLSAGVRSTRVVTWVIFMAASPRAQGAGGRILARRAARAAAGPAHSGAEGPASLKGRGSDQSRINGGDTAIARRSARAWRVPAGTGTAEPARSAEPARTARRSG